MHLDPVCVLGIIGVISETGGTEAFKAIDAGCASGAGHAVHVIEKINKVDRHHDLDGTWEIDGTEGHAGGAHGRADRRLSVLLETFHTDLSRAGGVVGHAAPRGVGSCL
jgi:hypothetical protein